MTGAALFNRKDKEMFKIYFQFVDGVPGIYHHVNCLSLVAAQRMWDFMSANEEIEIASKRP